MWEEVARVVTRELPSMTIIDKLFPQRDNVLEKDACTHIGGSADIVVDVYLRSDWEAVEEIAHSVQRWADCEEEPLSSTTGRYNVVDEYVCSAKRRNDIMVYRQEILSRCREDTLPHLVHSCQNSSEPSY